MHAPDPSHVYNNPKYYEIAYSFRDIEHEVDVFEDCMKRFAEGLVRRVLEIGCGNSPHMAELLSRGYEYVGLDQSGSMLDFAALKAASQGQSVSLIHSGMAEFEVDTPVDFAYVLLGSLYVRTNEELISHFDCMDKALRPGGIYFLDWCIDFDPLCHIAETWDAEADGITVRTTCMTHPVNSVEQTVEEHVVIDVEEDGNAFTLAQRTLKRLIYPQEFLGFIANRPDFEFVGWWNQWNLNEPIDGTSPTNRPITVIRRTH